MERYWQQMQQSGAPGNEKDGMSSSSAILPKASRQEAPQPLPVLPVDQIISASNQELETIFGTLCHNVIQNSLEDLGDMPSPQILAELEKLNMQDEQKILLIDTAKSLAKSFIQSELGQTAVNAKPLLKTEYAFLLPLYQNEPKPILIQGSIDLIFETPLNCFVIDFKTDKVLQSEAHRIQLECYQRAAQAFSDKPVKTLLVYLRNMQAVEVNSRLSDAELYTIAQEAISGC
jgi:ATP-dependent exoDNAse (exonuclease V) beta subunit